MTETPAPSGSATGGDDDIDRWQDALAAEHAVIWSYGLVGATGDLAEPADAALHVHRSRRAACIEALAEQGVEPVASAPAYDVAPPRNDSAARQLAAELESDAMVAYTSLAGAADRAARLVAARWLRESAIAVTGWDGQVPSLPGFEAA